MLLINSFIAKSEIEGVGVFAADPIKTGELIWRLDPTFDRFIEVSSLNFYPPHFKGFLARYAYQLEGYEDLLVLEVDNGRFMNHSDTPNTQYQEIIRGYARVDIAAGEELTCNYAEFDPVFRSTRSFTLLPNGSLPGISNHLRCAENLT
jgi:SET domain-containing protein